MRPRNSEKDLAKAEGRKHFQGKPCKYGHSGMRRTSTGTCLTCSTSYSYKANHNAKHKAWRDKNRQRVRDNQFNYNLYNKYGLTREEYDNMHAEQGHVCKICSKPQIGGVTLDRLVVDHCHDTGKVRGLLCANCNAGIGSLGDSIENLKAAIVYLENA